MSATGSMGPLADYWVDRWQRTWLFLDVLRQRGNTYQARKVETAPNVLDFEAELVCDGRSLPRPVNYVLARIRAPDDVAIDPVKPPFVIVDPRAGHGPGIGGMKQSSEIGVALAAGHACYFIGFLPEPVPEQTIEDVWEAEAEFIRRVADLHPDADGRPVVVANCQAGWQTAIMAALHPELTGPLVLAGAPLSYWQGGRGQNPMRYLGGLLGGSWLTALSGDLGEGVFDGANLVANFESLHPDNTLWTKPHNVYAHVDTERARFLDFETWWGSPVLLNAVEMQWIADNLFVGNKLTAGALKTRDGVRIDLRNIRAPVVVFCSWGDDITPPQQALGWIADLYEDAHEIAATGKTIVYALHETIGHLGIFVSGKVAGKEHAKFASCMSMVELAPPGLYEAVIAEPEAGAAHADLIEGGYLFRLEARTLDDIRALGLNPPEDDRRFAAAARVSETNKALYETLAQPFVRSLANPALAEWMRWSHPNRLRFAAFSDVNPWMNTFVAPFAAAAREDRRPVGADNPFLQLENSASAAITAGLENFGHQRDAMSQSLFLGVYGSPVVQAMAGVSKTAPTGGPGIEHDLVREAEQAKLSAEIAGEFEAGGALEACVRALLYVRLAEGAADERAFNLVRDLRASRPQERRIAKAQLKEILQRQSALLSIDEERAVGAIPRLLPSDAHERQALLDGLKQVLAAPGPLSSEGQRRLDRVGAWFAPAGAGSRPEAHHA
jgi:pimeloyl-ACP methyl ester carboxylesterase